MRPCLALSTIQPLLVEPQIQLQTIIILTLLDILDDEPLCKLCVVGVQRKAKFMKKCRMVDRVIPEGPDGYVHEVGPWADCALFKLESPVAIR